MKGVVISYCLNEPYRHAPIIVFSIVFLKGSRYNVQDIASQYQTVFWDKYIPKFNTTETYLSHLKKQRKNKRFFEFNKKLTNNIQLLSFEQNLTAYVPCYKSILKGLNSFAPR